MTLPTAIVLFGIWLCVSATWLSKTTAGWVALAMTVFAIGITLYCL